MPQTLNLDIVESVGDPAYITAAGTYVLKSTAGILIRVILGSSTDPNIEFYDGEDLVCKINAKEATGDVTLGIRCYTNVTVKTLADFPVTVTYL